MKIFCDTNIIMEYLQQRSQASLVGEILSFSSSRGDELFISSGSFYTITYLVEGYLKRDKQLQGSEKLRELREILNSVLDSFQIADSMTSSMKDGVNDEEFSDLEDSYQAHIAEDACCDVLLTINKRHFENFAKSSSVVVYAPTDFIDKLILNK